MEQAPEELILIVQGLMCLVVFVFVPASILIALFGKP